MPVVAQIPGQISEKQIEQFKKLPPSQQEALARSMGLDIKDIQAQINGTGKFSKKDESQKQPDFYPRGTRFDEFGNPIFEEGELEEMLAQEEEEEEELKPFGYEVFANSPATFAPTLDIAIPSYYTIGAGDVINIQMFGKENNEYQVPVNRNGQIIIPQLGPLTVAGLTFSELKAFVSNEVKNRVLGVEVITTLSELRSMRVFVLGDAFKPGPYVLSSLSSITHALFAAGGISDIGSLRNIQLKRGGKVITTLDLYDLLIKGDSSNDLMLQTGDVVFIAPVGKRVFVDGEVRRPAIYELAEDSTFGEVLEMAGGLLPSAFLRSTIVERYSKNNYRSTIDINLTEESDLSQKVQAGDYIHIRKTTEQYEESITLIGALTRPGKYQWKDGQRISDLLPEIDSHLLRHADLNYSLIVREIDIARNVEIHQFSLAKAITNTDSKDNITLQANDRVIVFSNATRLIEETITLDNLAYTQEELFKLEKKLAKDKFKTKLFWQKYGDDSAKYATERDLQAEEQEKLIKSSIAQITGGELEEEVDVKELALFSRQRLLMPIIEKLKRQGASGDPIQLVEVDGQVKFPGVYPLPRNGRINDLIAAAGGIEEAAFLQKAELTRNQIEGIEARKISKSVNLANALKGDETENVLLHSKDRLNVHKIPSWSENHVVELRGEFVFPGKYTIRRGETLADIVKKAGGLTEYAYAEGSVFSREKLKELEQQNLIKLASDLRVEMASKSLTSDKTTTPYEDAQNLLADLTKVEPVGRLVIDLPKVVEENNYDILLQGGDILYVPAKNNSINVIGQVQVTSSHVFDETLDAEDYIAQSGGMKKRADESRVYVIAANGSIKMLDSGNWFTNETALKPGDTVVVPLDSEYMNNLTLWSTATQIIYNTAVAIAAISGI